jgi:hypothetical protein
MFSQRGLLAMFVLSSAACGRAEEPAAPIATPTVTLSRPDVSIGSPVDLRFRFTVAADAPTMTEDYMVFVHFVDADGELMWTDDHEPATPTRQWKAGASVEYSRTTFMPKFPYTGETRIEIGLFSPETGARLPLAGDDMGMRAYRVATFNLRLQSDNVFVVFTSGWHETEVADEATGVEWQWTKREAALSFRNPRRDVTMFLQLDQPVAALKEARQVEVRLGQIVVDQFALSAGARELRRLEMSAAQMGDSESVEIVIAVDKTFVPSSVPELRSTDSRELGVRVFRAFVQPR